MNKLLSKLIISIAIGIIVSQLVGNLTKVTRYYWYVSPKSEVTYERFMEEKETKLNAKHYKEEKHFNKSNALTYGLISFSIVAIALFSPGIFKKPKN
jgi:uncharacterized membrane-anchored protein YhcB (DUF1043 family)